MSIAQPQQCQVIDIRNKDTKVHVNSFECIILTKERANTSAKDDNLFCESITIGSNELYVGDIILAEDINMKLVLPFKIAKISKFDLSKELKQITLHSFIENPSITFLAPTIGNIAFNIKKSPLFIGAYAYYEGLQLEEFRYSVHFLLHYNKRIRNDKQFKNLNDLIEKQSLKEDYRFDIPFDNSNYIVLTIKAKTYWQETYNIIMRSQYSKLNNAYKSYLSNYLDAKEYAFVESIINKSDILKTAWEEHLKMTLPKSAELYQAMNIETTDALTTDKLISLEDYERIKRLARYMV